MNKHLAMEFADYGAIALFLLFCYYLLCLSRSSKPKSGPPPPEARGAWPITGHIHLMGGGSTANLPHINLTTLADKYGPIFTIRLGVHRVLIVSSSELAKELFTTFDVAVSSRPSLTAAKHLTYDFAMFGFSPYGAYWREIRKLVSSELLSNRRIELQRNVTLSETEQFIKELYKVWEEKKDGSDKVLVDMKQWFGELNLNVVLRMVVGKRFNNDDDSEETRRCREVMKEFFHLAGMFVPADALPYLGWLDIGGHEKRMKHAAKELDRIVSGWLAEHRRKKDQYSDKDMAQQQDFMDVMLSVVQQGGARLEEQYDADTVIKATCGVLIFGASDGLTVMLVWALSLLLNHPVILKKAQEELDKLVGRDRRVNDSDINKLVYLQSIVKETLRLYPASPLGGTREFMEDCIVGGYRIPKGTWLMVNLWKLHRDPVEWPDEPLEFKPERFLNMHKNMDVKSQDFKLMPFGAGRRSCAGTNFGLHMMHSVLAHILHSFEFSTMFGDKVDMTGSAGITNLKLTPLDVLIAPRLSPHLY